MEERQLTGAERGTLMHRALSLIPLESMRGAADLYSAVKLAVHDMADREIFTYQEVMLLYLKGLAEFFRSDIGQRMLRSPRVQREWAFNLVMDDRGTILQGVIDCAFLEDGAWVLVDYKTDRITDEERANPALLVKRLGEAHGHQLAAYTKALRDLLGRAPDEMRIYSLPLGMSLLIE